MQQIYDKEKASMTLAKLKRDGVVFEVSVDSEAAIKFKKGEIDRCQRSGP